MDPSREAQARRIEARIGYLLDSSKINRRFCSRHEDANTGEYAEYGVDMHDGSGLEDAFQADVHGFQLMKAPTSFAAWDDPGAISAGYAPQTLEMVRDFLGADRMAGVGHALRTAGDPVQRNMGPPACEAHVDFEASAARRYAAAMYEQHHPGAPPFSRFVAFSLWRPLTPPPHDWPLAVCDFRSVDPDEGERNVMVVCDEIPPREKWFDPIEGEEALPAAYIFRHNPRHRWWYFSRMGLEDALFIKFHDSDRTRAWRCPHSAFRNQADPDPNLRESIEFRGFAFFN
jgi:hypothetical protein